jgi:TonB family protein
MPLPPHLGGSFTASLVLAAFLLGIFATDLQAQRPAEPDEQDVARGIQLYQQGDLAESVKLLSAAVKKHPDNADAWCYLGLALNTEGLIGGARPAFGQCVRLRPDYADAHAKLAYALILANEFQRAIAVASRALELGDQSPEAHYAIAEASFRTGASVKALEEAEAALNINPNFLPALITKSLVHTTLKQYDEAAASLEKLLAISANFDVDVWREQLKTLRSLANPMPGAGGEKLPLTGKEVSQRVQVVSKPEPSYTEAARKAGVTGVVVLRAVFSSTGEVRDILVTRALGYGLTTQAVKATQKIKFTPATKDGSPVSMYVQLEYNFSLF